MANRFFRGTGNWSDINRWAESPDVGAATGFSVPTNADDVFFDASSGNCTVDVSVASCANLYLRGWSDTDLTIGSSDYIGTISLGVNYLSIYAVGSKLVFSPTCTITCTLGTGGIVAQRANTVYLNGATTIIPKPNFSNSTYAITNSSDKSSVTTGVGTISTLSGVISNATYNVSVTCSIVNFGQGWGTGGIVNITNNSILTAVRYNNVSLHRIICEAGSALQLSTNSASVFNFNPLATSSIDKLIIASTILNFNTPLNIGTSTVFTINNLEIQTQTSGASTPTIKFYQSIWTISGDIIVQGSTSYLIKLDSYNGTSQFTWSKAGGVVDGKYLNLKNSAAIGGATFYAGTTPPSVNSGNNSGWLFEDAPADVEPVNVSNFMIGNAF